MLYLTPRPIFFGTCKIYPQTYISFLPNALLFRLTYNFGHGHIFFDKCSILHPDLYFLSNTLFYPQTYTSLAKCIIFLPDAYFLVKRVI